VCVGFVVVVWVAGALYSAVRSAPPLMLRVAARNQPGLMAGDGGLIGVAVVCLGLAVSAAATLTAWPSGPWGRVLGLAVLVASSVFTLWAGSRSAPWAWRPVKGDHQLRTGEPYAVTSSDLHRGARDVARCDAAQRDRSVDRAFPGRPDRV
jgi:hypothetical protein